jgi:uncharacterized protein
MPHPRYLEPAIQEDLKTKMVFLAGPRQVGKTTLARHVLEILGGGTYLSWDNREDRAEIRAARWPGGNALVVLDELHKWRGWKRWIKGEFDKHRERIHFLVTGIVFSLLMGFFGGLFPAGRAAFTKIPDALRQVG